MHLRQAATPPPNDDLEQFMDPAMAKKLKKQSVVDATDALMALSDPNTSWEKRRDAAHYAVGSTGIVGFNQLSVQLSNAEQAAKDSDQATLDLCIIELKKTLSI